MEGLLSESVCKRTVVVRSEPITDHYIVEARPFARGKFATVRRCRHRTSGVEYAAKYMRKRRRACDVRHEILHEAHVLELSRMHPHIVRMHEVYETPSEIVLLLELVPGGELQRVLDDEEVVPEAEARRLLRQILDGVAFLHQHNIAHLDLKPQNLLLTKPFPEGEVKLCDFGISRLITKGIEIREIVGTPDYVAPEVLHYEPISLPTDMWSLGILTYVLLSGHSPFGGDTKQETFCNITRGSLDFPQDLFAGVSDCAVDFVRKLLLRTPKERMTAEECLSHPWISGGGSMLPGIQLTLSPENNTLAQTENEVSTRSPSPLQNLKDTSHHKSPSPKLSRSSVKSQPATNGRQQKDHSESSCLIENSSSESPTNGVATESSKIHQNGSGREDCKSPSLVTRILINSPSQPVPNGVFIDSSLVEHNGEAEGLVIQCNGDSHSQSVLGNGLSPKVTSVETSSSVKDSGPSWKDLPTQCDGKENKASAKLNDALDTDICQSPKSSTAKSEKVTLSVFNGSSLSLNGNEQERSGIHSRNQQQNGQKVFCQTVKVSKTVFNGSSLHCSEREVDTSMIHGKQQHNGNAFCHSVKVSKSVFNSSYNEQESNTSSNGHSLKVTRSVCKNSSNEQDTLEDDAISDKSPQRNGSFRQSPSPSRREQKSRNSVDMMVSQFEGISKRIVFSEDICVDERVGMVY